MAERSNRTKYLVASGVCAGIVVGVIAARATPGTSGGATKTSLAFAGALTDANGNPLTGTHSLAFTFHNAANTCTTTVTGVTAQAPSGAFQIEVPLDTCPTFFDGADVTVDINVDGTNQVITGQPVDPVAYAHYSDKAANAIQAGHATSADQPTTACAAGSVLTTIAGGAFGCVALPTVPTIPTCTGSQVLTSVGGTLTCVTPATGGVATYVGNTTITTNGAITHSGFPVGLQSANAFCADQFGAGAHMCSEPELYQSVVTGAINASTTVLAAWFWFPNWQTPNGAGTVLPTSGLADNCASYTYPTAHRLWTGTTVQWNVIADTGSAGFTFNGGSASAACNQTNPIACCQ